MRIEDGAALKLLCEYAETLAKQLTSAADDLEKAKQDILSSRIEQTAVRSADRLMETSNQAYQHLRAFFEGADRLRWQSKNKSQALCGNIDPAIREECRRLGICAAFLPDASFILKTVHPISRYSKRASKSPHDMEIMMAISDAVEAAARQNPQSSALVSGPVIFSFWHVYRPSSESGYAPPDNDNYLTKSIIDIICNALGLSDMGTAAYMFHGAVETESVPEATYVFVAPMAGDTASKILCFDSAKQYIPASLLSPT